MRRFLGVCVAAAMALAAGALDTGAADSRLHYAYDAAGRLVRVGDGSGRFVLYRHDPAGNVLGAETRRVWHVAVKKPAKGAWILQVAADGTLDGHGGDDRLGLYRITGTLDADAAGVVEIRDPDSGALLETLALAGGAVDIDPGTGASRKLVLKGPDGVKAVGLPPQGALPGFRGSYGNSRNLLKIGSGKFALGRVDFVEEGTRAGVTLVDGALRGFLVRDPKGKAYGVLEHEGETFVVLSKLKDGAKSVKAKSGKGAPVKLRLKVKK